ncbi:MAG: ABC transporter substrate-binding protein [Candidatus Eremiobacteraeota bacterium]|nr:ABC transporter substrate-binding protein [Candidatus Eremiobacteraeota bacterium]
MQETTSASVTSNIYETLVRFDRRSFDTIPSLALSWTVKDSRVWTFALRKNVKFHDGTLCDAWAVKFNFDRQRDPRHPFHYPSYGRFHCYDSLFGSYRNAIEKVEVLDPYTLRIVLLQPDCMFLRKIALPYFAIVSPASVKKWKDEFYQNPVGTGPFRFTEWRKPSRIVLSSNRDYWGKKPFLDRIIFEPYRDPVSCLRQLERGNLDLVSLEAYHSADDLKNRENITVVKLPRLHLCYLALNCLRFPFQQKNARLALSYLVNRQELCSRTPMIAASAVIPPGMPGYVRHESFPYNLKKGSALAAQCRWPSRMVMLCPEGSLPTMADPGGIALKVSEYLRKGGVKVTVQKLPYGEFARRVRYGEYELALWGAMDETGDADTFLTTSWDPMNARQGGSNVCFYQNAEIGELLVKARRTPEKGKRAACYKKIQELLLADMPMVPLGYQSQAVAFQQRVRDFSPHPSGLFVLDEVWLAR